MYVLRFWVAISAFAAILKLLKLHLVVKLDTYLNNEHFDILHDFVSQLWAQLCLFHGFWRPFLFFGRHFENRGLIFAAREKKWCIHPKETTLQFWCFCPACNKIDKKSF